MPLNKVVVKTKSGEILKGSTADFLPKRTTFHLTPIDKHCTACMEIVVESLKAIFFVKDFRGSKTHLPPLAENQRLKPKEGEKLIEVTFNDGEIIEGLAHSFHLERSGFFMTPTDPRSNNQRIYVLLSSVDHLNVNGTDIPVKQLKASSRKCPTCHANMEFTWNWCPFDGAKL